MKNKNKTKWSTSKKVSCSNQKRLKPNLNSALQNHFKRSPVEMKISWLYYLQPFVNTSTNIWYKKVPMGINSIYYEMNSLMSGSEEREGWKKKTSNSHTKKHDKPFYKKSTCKKIKTLKSPKICNKQDHWPQSWSTYMLMIAVRKCSKNKCPTFLSFQMTINFFKIYQHVILSALITVRLSYE